MVAQSDEGLRYAKTEMELVARRTEFLEGSWAKKKPARSNLLSPNELKGEFSSTRKRTPNRFKSRRLSRMKRKNSARHSCRRRRSLIFNSGLKGSLPRERLAVFLSLTNSCLRTGCGLQDRANSRSSRARLGRQGLRHHHRSPYP